MKKIVKNLPSGWVEKSLKENTLFLRRGKSPEYCDNNQGLVVVNQECIRWDSINMSNVKFHVVPNKIEEDFFLRCGDILINSTGTGTIGRVNEWLYPNVSAIADSHVTVFRVNKETIDAKYARYFLTSELGQRYLESLCYTGSTNQIELSKRYLLKLRLPCAPLPEQKAISGILSKVDKAIEVVEKSIKAAEHFKKSLTQNLLTGKLKPDGTWRNEDEFYLDEKFGNIPKGWEVARVKDFGIVYTGKTPPTVESHVFSESLSENRYPFVTPADFFREKYIDVSERYVTEKGLSYSYRLPVNSICIVCIGSTIGKIGIAKVEICTNQQINSLIPNRNNSGEFFYYMMSYRVLHFKEIAAVNATPQINKSNFNKYQILRPLDKSEQKKIANWLSVWDDEIFIKNNKVQSLKTLKKSLMQNLLTGKVRVDVEKVNKLLEEV
ncbi:MAG: restriction endonuclease subunit S [Candidatus Theseobacter exili]|nr:restriction endonuclease subunit S [Candidatus Theseobacter exili]